MAGPHKSPLKSLKTYTPEQNFVQDVAFALSLYLGTLNNLIESPDFP